MPFKTAVMGRGKIVLVSVQHMLVILDQAAAPFCAYENPYYHSLPAPRWIAPQLLSAFVRQANKNAISATFLFGKTRPPAEIERLIESVEHSKIVPLGLETTYPDAILVLDADERFSALHNSLDRNIILRTVKPKGVSALVEALLGKFKRLSLHFTGTEYFTETDYTEYEDELARIAKMLGGLYRNGSAVELNVLSDRLLLTAMRNCGAGADHLTLAPNGKLYICPAFYYDDPESALAAFDAKKPLKCLQATELSRAPLCSRCDAFHCKRCIFLNRRTTCELNVPLEQQCAVAHIEREASRRMLIDLGTLEPFRRMPRITELTYRDPLECIDLPPGDATSDPML